MRTFVDHVNASLPVDKPDYILELLVKSHDGIACGNTCPQGQHLEGNGRCLPAVVVAQSNRGSSPASGATLAQRQGRSQVAVPAASSVDARTRLAQPNQTTSSSTAPAVQQVAGADPLPCRMSVGGPPTALGSLALRQRRTGPCRCRAIADDSRCRCPSGTPGSGPRKRQPAPTGALHEQPRKRQAW